MTLKIVAARLRFGGRHVLAMLACLILLAPAAQAQETLRIGVLDYLGSDHSLSHWKPTEAALDAALPGYDFRFEPLDIHQLDAALAAQDLDFVITNPGNYAELEYRHHISRIATAQSDQPVGSTLVTTKDLKALDDLAGRKLAITAPEAFGGFQVIWSEMLKADPRLPAKVQLEVTGYPMQRAAQAVLDGRADAAVLRPCMLEQLQRDDPARYGTLHAFALQPSGQTQCALSSRVYPGWPFAKTPATSPELAKQVAIALMQMPSGNRWTVPLDYQPVHDLLRQLQLGPYARTGPVNLRDFIADYRDWLIALAVALMFWALYSVRIETLVRRRTRALDAANTQLKQEMIERERAETADRLHMRELEHVARLSILGEMASSIAHELNQPLSAISNYAQGCLLRLKTGNFSQGDMETASGEIAAQAERAATVIRRIRAFVRKRESQRAQINICELLTECSALYHAQTHRAGVRVEVLCAEGLPQVIGDRVHLTQVILNLVQNAVDAMAQTEPAQRRILITAERAEEPGRGAGICLSLRDRGTGMSETAMAHFAEAFYTTKPEGIGLGLALSRSIIEAHGGWMRAQRPADGVGLRVAIWLPIGEDAA
ncbi:PhnD/SsuA/transferrin family substrate-binding protein [Thioclava sp. 15-R06ZXC-3]|uniref:histidine kinase n=1 Tax=Thioclava arctica TaxID=3238301 RepID=A0ABV3TFI6_9RHOB